MGWDGTNVPVSPRCLGGAGRRLQPQRGPAPGFLCPASRTHLGTGEWPAVPSLRFSVVPGLAESSEGQPQPLQPAPAWVGAKMLYSKRLHLQLPCEDPPGDPGGGPGSSPHLNPS